MKRPGEVILVILPRDVAQRTCSKGCSYTLTPRKDVQADRLLSAAVKSDDNYQELTAFYLPHAGLGALHAFNLQVLRLVLLSSK